MNEARLFFKGMPDEVFELYLFPLISELGWPFQYASQSVVGTKWHRVLNGVELMDLVNAKWGFGKIDLLKVTLHPDSQKDIDLVIDNSNSNMDTFLGYDFKRCRESFRFNQDYLLKHGEFIAPIVLLQTSDSYLRVLDGNHRLAGFQNIRTLANKSQPVWVGSSAEQPS